MAMFSMMIVLMLLIGTVCFILFVAGLVLLFTGIRKKKKSMEQGTARTPVQMKIGIAFMAVPVIAGVVLISKGFSWGLGFFGDDYSNLSKRWREHWVSDEAAGRQALEAMFRAAEKNDKDAIRNMYPDGVRDDPKLSKQIDQFLEDYPGGFAGLEYDSKGGSASGSTDRGKSKKEFYYSYVMIRDGEYYYIHVGACFQNTEHPEEVGLAYFILNSEKAEVRDDESEEGREYSAYLLSDMAPDADYETRRVWGHPWKFTPVDRTLTKEDVIEAVKNSPSLSDVEEKLGKPNGIKGRLREALYELVPEGGEPRYAELTYDYYGRIYIHHTHFAGTEQDYGEWLNEEGELVEEE